MKSDENKDKNSTKISLRSLPFVSDTKIKKGLAVLYDLKGTVPPSVWNTVDNKAGDIRRFFRQIRIVETESNDNYVCWTSDGKVLAELLFLTNELNTYYSYLHNIFLARIPQYYYLQKLLKENPKTTFEKKELFQKLKETLINLGYELPEPTFNTIIALAEATHLIEKRGSSVSANPDIIKQDYLSLILICIRSIVERKNNSIIKTIDVIACINNKLSNKQITPELVIDFIKNNAIQLKVNFEQGVGTKGVLGKYALLKVNK